jgi:hypothetical protein
MPSKIDCQKRRDTVSVLAIALGGTPVGAPIVGWVADTFGPSWSLGVGAASGFAAAIVGIHYLTKYRRLRIDDGRLRSSIDGGDPLTDSLPYPVVLNKTLNPGEAA